MKNIAISAQNVCTEVEFFEFLGIQDYINVVGRDSYIAPALTKTTYYIMGRRDGDISRLVLDNMLNRVLAHLMYSRNIYTFESKPFKFEVSDSMCEDVVSALKTLQLNGLLSSFSVSIITKEVELQERVKELESKIQDLEDNISKKYSVSHIGTVNGNFLINISNSENENLFYANKNGKVLRYTSNFSDDDDSEFVDEWDWARHSWGQGIVSGLPLFTPIVVEKD